MPAAPSIEVSVILRLAFDVSAPYAGVGSNKKPFEVCSCTGDGHMIIGGESIQLSRFQVSKFKQGEVDPLFDQVLTLKRGDKVRFAMALEARPYTQGSNGTAKERWALQPGQVYSVKVLESVEQLEV